MFIFSLYLYDFVKNLFFQSINIHTLVCCHFLLINGGCIRMATGFAISTRICFHLITRLTFSKEVQKNVFAMPKGSAYKRPKKSHTIFLLLQAHVSSCK